MKIRVQLRASRDAIVGWRGEALGVRVTAPPVDGRANAAVGALLAAALGVRPAAVKIVRGQTGRDKVVSVAGLSLAEVRARLATFDGGRG